jgi:hypothetical protein
MAALRNLRIRQSLPRQGGTFFPLWAQYLSSGSAIPLLEAVSVLTCCLVFFDAVRGHRCERPISGESEKRFPIFVSVSLNCPLCALLGKLSVFARCDHGGIAPLNLPDR